MSLPIIWLEYPESNHCGNRRSTTFWLFLGIGHFGSIVENCDVKRDAELKSASLSCHLPVVYGSVPPT